jgi:hypothetical protein
MVASQELMDNRLSLHHPHSRRALSWKPPMTCLLPPQNAVGQNSQLGDQFFGINTSNHNRS